MDKTIETVTIIVMNPKAYKLLEGMEDLDLIKILKDSSKISSLRGTIKFPMNNEEIDKQLKELRD